MNTITNAQQWLDTTLYPFEPRYMKLQAGNMHYVDEGQGEVILFVHGTPTWSFLYRDFIKAFSKNNRCIAVDHTGFGLSDKPEDFPGTPKDHAQNLQAFITQMDLQDITLVVHDFGGPIGLGAAMENPERIKRVVIFNTWLWETKNNKDARKVDRIVNSRLGKFMYLNMNFSPKVLLKQGFADKKKLTKQVHRHYIKPFPDRSSRMGLLNLARSLVGSSDWYEQQWQQLDKLAGKEWLILWGLKDTFVTTEYLDKWKRRLPHATVKAFDCGHFVQEEQTLEEIAAMDEFLKK